MKKTTISLALALSLSLPALAQASAAPSGASVADGGVPSGCANDCDCMQQAINEAAQQRLASRMPPSSASFMQQNSCVDNLMNFSIDFGASIPGIDAIVNGLVNYACGLVSNAWNQAVNQANQTIGANVNVAGQYGVPGASAGVGGNNGGGTGVNGSASASGGVQGGGSVGTNQASGVLTSIRQSLRALLQ